MNEERQTIEWDKFQALEKKYSDLCQKYKKIENKLDKFDKLPQAIMNDNTQEGLYLDRVSSGKSPRQGIIYLRETQLKKGECQICLEKKETTAHHIIPIRVKCKSERLAQVRIRVCVDCEKKLHPENGYSESEILEKQDKEIRSLKKRLQITAGEILQPFLEYLNNRQIQMASYIKTLPGNLKDTPRRIEPAIKQTAGRLKELKRLKGFLKDRTNSKLNTNYSEKTILEAQSPDNVAGGKDAEV